MSVTTVTKIICFFCPNLPCKPILGRYVLDLKYYYSYLLLAGERFNLDRDEMCVEGYCLSTIFSQLAILVFHSMYASGKGHWKYLCDRPLSILRVSLPSCPKGRLVRISVLSITTFFHSFMLNK
jgi:hypothetical protein